MYHSYKQKSSLSDLLKNKIKIRENNPSNYSSDYSRGETRGYKEILKIIERDY